MTFFSVTIILDPFLIAVGINIFPSTLLPLIAKKMLLVQAQAYRQQYGMNIIYAIPVNLYGPNDNFEVNSSHVIPALIRKFIDARDNNKSDVINWGTGQATREFLYVDDCADGLISCMQNYNSEDPVNIVINQTDESSSTLLLL